MIYSIFYFKSIQMRITAFLAFLLLIIIGCRPKYYLFNPSRGIPHKNFILVQIDSIDNRNDQEYYKIYFTSIAWYSNYTLDMTVMDSLGNEVEWRIDTANADDYYNMLKSNSFRFGYSRSLKMSKHKSYESYFNDSWDFKLKDVKRTKLLVGEVLLLASDVYRSNDDSLIIDHFVRPKNMNLSKLIRQN